MWEWYIRSIRPATKPCSIASAVAGDGATPTSGVIRDKQGNLYGTTLLGGSAGGGIVYKLDPAGRETVLHNFTGGNDGTKT